MSELINVKLVNELYAERESVEKKIEKLEAKIYELNERITDIDEQIHEEELKPEEE